MSSLSRLVFARPLSHWAAVSGFPESSLDLALSPEVLSHGRLQKPPPQHRLGWSRGLNQNHPDWCLRKALITKKRNHCTGPATAGAECAEPELGVPVRSSHPRAQLPGTGEPVQARLRFGWRPRPFSLWELPGRWPRCLSMTTPPATPVPARQGPFRGLA